MLSGWNIKKARSKTYDVEGQGFSGGMEEEKGINNTESRNKHRQEMDRMGSERLPAGWMESKGEGGASKIGDI